jgi:predicted small lipoprotein YifL
MRKTILWTYLLLAAVSVVACGRSGVGSGPLPSAPASALRTEGVQSGNAAASRAIVPPAVVYERGALVA